MNKRWPVGIFIILVCSFYAYLSSVTPSNMDERVSIVIALGKFPPLADQFQRPHSPQEYLALIDYTHYNTDSILFKKVFQSIVNDNSNAAIYYFLLSALIKTAGYHLWWPRLLSIILAGVNLFLIFLLAGKFQNRIFFMWTTVIMTAINPVFILNAILVRGYMLALLGCLLSIFFLVKLVSEKTCNRPFIGYFLGVLLAAGSHYFTFSVLAAEFVFILWNWRKQWSMEKKFLLGYGGLVLLAAIWFLISYPVSWNNLQYLLKDNTAIAEIDSGYKLTFPNLFRQWMNISTYFFSFTTDGMGKIRMAIKCITGMLFLIVLARLYMLRFRQPGFLLFALIFFTMIFYSCQSLFEGQLISFIPKYLVFIIPLAIIGINVVISECVSQRGWLTGSTQME